MKNPQYATIEQAQRLKEAGFDKQCIHEASFTDEQIIIFAYDNTIEELDNNTFLNDVILPLPTLGEIPLPECVCVIKRPSGTYHIYTNDDLELDTPAPLSIFVAYETELEARVEAYLWAKANLPATE